MHSFSFIVADQSVEFFSDSELLLGLMHRFVERSLATGNIASGGSALRIECLSAAAERSSPEHILSADLPPAAVRLRLNREEAIQGWATDDELHLHDRFNRLDLRYDEGYACCQFDVDQNSDHRLLTHTYFMVALIELLRTRSLYYLHGAMVSAVSPGHESLLLLGDGGAGKSTTAYLLARQGWKLVTDDALLIRWYHDRPIELYALLKELSLDQNLSHLIHDTLFLRRDTPGKAIVDPRHIGSDQIRPLAMPSRVFLLERHQQPTAYQPMPRSHLMAQFIRQNIFLFLNRQLSHEHLMVLASMARTVRGYRLMLGPELLHHGHLLAQIIEEVCSSGNEPTAKSLG